MEASQGHPIGADPRAFLEGVRSLIRAKLEKEIQVLDGISSKSKLQFPSLANSSKLERFSLIVGT